jgi:hypothetical protein
LRRAGKQGHGLGFGLGTVAVVDAIAGSGTRDGRLEGMNQHVGMWIQQRVHWQVAQRCERGRQREMAQVAVRIPVEA